MCNKPSPKPKVTYFQRKHENVFSIYIIPLQYRQLKFFFMEHVPGPSYLHNHQSWVLMVRQHKEPCQQQPWSHSSTIQVIEFFFMEDQDIPILHDQTSWVLMVRRHKEPHHQQPWYWHYDFFFFFFFSIIHMIRVVEFLLHSRLGPPYYA